MKNFVSRYKPEIDGLRGFAVVAVIINHFNENAIASGFLGVDIFFVISGFVITSSISAKSNQKFQKFILGFYQRRIKRLVPALIFFVLIMAICICLFNPEPTLSLRTGISSLFGLSNIYLIKQSTDYFGESTKLNIFTHTWSLGVEEQFYLLFPFLTWFTGFASKTKRGLRNLFFITLFLTIFSFSLYLYYSIINKSIAYFSMPTRFWEISTGALLYLLFEKKNFFVKKIENISPSLIFLGIILIMFFPVNFSVFSTVLIVLLTSALIICLKKGTILYAFFTKQKVVFLGLISYSLYLWHWGILALSRWTFGIYWWSIPFQIFLLFSFAYISYKYIESPLRKFNWSKFDILSILIGCISLLLSSFSIFILDLNLSNKLYRGDKEVLKAVKKGNSLSDSTNIYSKKNFGGGKCYLMGNNDVGKKIDLDNCILGDFEKADKRLLVIGNSYSSSFLNSFQDVVKENNSVVITSSWSSSPVPLIPNYSPRKQINKYYWNKLIPSFLEKLKKGDVVLIMAALPQFINGELEIDILERGIRDFSKKLSEKSLNLLFLNTIPSEFKDKKDNACDPIKSTKTWYNYTNNCDPIFKDKKTFLKERADLSSMLMRLEEENFLVVVDLLDIFCPENICTFRNKEGIILYRDIIHPSARAAQLSSSIIKESFDKLLKKDTNFILSK